MASTLEESVKVAVTIDPATVTATTTGQTVDRGTANPADKIMAVFQTGKVTEGTVTPSIQVSDDASNWDDADATELGGAFVALDDDVTARSIQEVEYLGLARYVRIKATFAQVTTGVPIAGQIVLGSFRTSPV